MPQPLRAQSESSEPTPQPSSHGRTDLEVVVGLFDDLHEQPAYNLVIESLLENIDWERADSAILAKAFAVLMEDPTIGPAIAHTARREHRDLCACCRSKNEIALKVSAFRTYLSTEAA